MTNGSNAAGKITRRRWAAAEDDVIRDLYGSTPANVIAAQLGRTEDAVWQRAVRVLGLGKRNEVAPWSEAELAELRCCYSTDAPTAIAERLGRTASAVYQQARCMNLLSRKMLVGQSAVASYFDHIGTAEQAYILGLLAADGNVHDNRIAFGLQAKDAALVEFVRNRLSPLTSLSTATRDGFVYFQITSQPMADGLAKWGIIPRKSRSLAWPAQLGDMLRPFLLGYFDGDGSAYLVRRPGRVYPGWTVCSGSEQFLRDMSDYIRTATGVQLQEIQHRPRTSLYQVATTGRGAFALDGWLHQDGLGLQRKRFPEEALSRYRG